MSRRHLLQSAAAGAIVFSCVAKQKSKIASQNLGEIVRAAIHPAIGIARVGNSTAPKDYYIGPEFLDAAPIGADLLRSPDGALRRQDQWYYN